MRGLRRERARFFIPFCVSLEDFKSLQFAINSSAKFFQSINLKLHADIFFYHQIDRRKKQKYILSAEEIIIMTTTGTAAGKKHPMKPSYPAVLDSIFPHCRLHTVRPAFGASPTLTRLGGTLRRFPSIYYEFHRDDFLVIRSRKELAMCHL